MDMYKDMIRYLLDNNITDLEDVQNVIKQFCRKYHPKKVPSFIDVLLHAEPDDLKRLSFIKTKPIRTLSGVAPIAIMTYPFVCPHGKCTYCPGGPNSYFGDVPQSYTGKEPSTMRAIRNNYDPYLIVFNRLEQFTLLNQNRDKVELIFQGGTFPSFPQKYQEDEIAYSLKALNDFSDMFYDDFEKFKTFFELPSENFASEDRTRRIKAKLLELKGKTTLSQEVSRNEHNKIRCVALCIETRPDWSKKEHINNMLTYGTTRVELGVQNIYNDILDKVNRGHSVEDTIQATQLLKDSFLKVGYHMMLGLPGSDNEKDISMIGEIYTNPDFKPDFVKFYPTSVLKGTVLYQQYLKEEYKPISTEDALTVLNAVKPTLPEWTRVMRVQRDIPSTQLVAGVKVTNLRQLITARCNCIRCREPKNTKVSLEDAKLVIRKYSASGGEEQFISYESHDKILGFCRLRLPHKPFRKEIDDKTVGIRELHVYSESLGLGQKSDESIQHKGLGIKLMEHAEKIAQEEYDAKKIIVISGIGVREYYKDKLGYSRDGPYMSKRLL